VTSAQVVAVTGATGFLGVHLIKALAGEGVRIRILSRHSNRHEAWRDIDLDIIPGRLEDAGALERLAAGADAIVHAAGLIKARDRAAFLQTNRDGTRAVAETTRRSAPDARFIAISSLAAREPQLSDYAFSKHAGEDAAQIAYADAPDRLVIVRPPAIYGPWDRETLAIFKAASQPVIPVFGSGRAAIMHVTDAAASIARLAVDAGVAGHYALADTNPDGYGIQDIMDEAARAAGNDHPRFIRLPDSILLAAAKATTAWGVVRRRTPIFTVGKVREMLHADWGVTPAELLPQEIYRSKIGISEGFRETVAWYRSAGWLR
jgi:nucleoside-diphosphate-sugar epimerase